MGVFNKSVTERRPEISNSRFLANGISKKASALIKLTPPPPEKVLPISSLVFILIVLETPSLYSALVPFLLTVTLLVTLGL